MRTRGKRELDTLEKICRQQKFTLYSLPVKLPQLHCLPRLCALYF
jgi:hypothetical protein